MGSWFSKEPIIVQNTISATPKEPIVKNMNSLNLSLEEILKEISIIVVIVLLWEIIKKKINDKAQKKGNKNCTIIKQFKYNLKVQKYK